MTVSNTVDRVQYTGNGSATSWAYTFYIGSTDELTVSLITVATGAETVLSASQYTFTPDSDFIGGSITYPKAGGTPISSAYAILIRRTTPRTQTLQLTNQGAFNPALLENALDKLTRIAQELDASRLALEDEVPSIVTLTSAIEDLQAVAAALEDVSAVASIADILEQAGHLDGGRADSVYTNDQVFDGGGASG